MFTIPTSMYLVVNVIIILIAILCAYIGYREGLVSAIINLVGSIAAIYVAWLIAPILSGFVNIVPRSLAPLQDNTLMASAAYQFVNEAAWFIIAFIILKIIVFLLSMIAKDIHKIPGFHLISGITGAIFETALAIVWVLVICVVLSLPIFTNGTDVINNTWLGDIRSFVGNISEEYVEPFMNSDAFNEFIEDAENIPDEQREIIRQWLEEHGYDTSEIEVEEEAVSTSTPTTE